MRFQRLRLAGFKSFVDATELRIEDGLTGVVGPNGCGKSNLLEASRTALGDSSHKSIAGGGLETVTRPTSPTRTGAASGRWRCTYAYRSRARACARVRVV